jgi:hypothetical protein
MIRMYDYSYHPRYDDDDDDDSYDCQTMITNISLYLSLMYSYSLDAGTHKRAGTTNISNCERNQ